MLELAPRAFLDQVQGFHLWNSRHRYTKEIMSELYIAIRIICIGIAGVFVVGGVFGSLAFPEAFLPWGPLLAFTFGLHGILSALSLQGDLAVGQCKVLLGCDCVLMTLGYGAFLICLVMFPWNASVVQVGIGLLYTLAGVQELKRLRMAETNSR